MEESTVMVEYWQWGREVGWVDLENFQRRPFWKYFPVQRLEIFSRPVLEMSSSPAPRRSTTLDTTVKLNKGESTQKFSQFIKSSPGFFTWPLIALGWFLIFYDGFNTTSLLPIVLVCPNLSKTFSESGYLDKVRTCTEKWATVGKFRAIEKLHPELIL